MAGIGDIAGIDEGRDGIVSAMLGDLVGEQAPGLSNTAQGTQQAGLTELGGTPPGGLPTGINDSPFGNLSGAPATFGTQSGISPPGFATSLMAPLESLEIQHDLFDQQENQLANPDYYGALPQSDIFGPGPQQGSPPPIGDPMSPTFGGLMADPEALGAFASATQQGAPPVGQSYGPAVGQSGKGGANAPIAGMPDYAITDPFGELGAFGPDAYGQPGSAPPPGGVNTGPYGEFGGFGPDAYGAMASTQEGAPGGFGGGFGAGAYGAEGAGAYGQSGPEGSYGGSFGGGFDGFDGFDGQDGQDGYGDDADGDDDGDDGDDGDD